MPIPRSSMYVYIYIYRGSIKKGWKRSTSQENLCFLSPITPRTCNRLFEKFTYAFLALRTPRIFVHNMYWCSQACLIHISCIFTYSIFHFISVKISKCDYALYIPTRSYSLLDTMLVLSLDSFIHFHLFTRIFLRFQVFLRSTRSLDDHRIKYKKSILKLLVIVVCCSDCN